MMRCLFVLLGVCWLAACASSPTPRFHALQARAEAGAEPKSSVRVVVEAVGLPAGVDRKQIVLGTGRPRFEDFDLWAAPLREDLGRVIALDLSRQLGAEQVGAWPQTRIAEPDFRVFVDLARFESEPGVQALIEASWMLRNREDKLVASGRSVHAIKPTGGDLDALVEAHDRALAELSAEIARAIRATSR